MRDYFVLHPNIPDAYKFTSRLKDRIELINSGRFLPIVMENHIRQDDLVHEYVVFGRVGYFQACLLFLAGRRSVWPRMNCYKL